MMDAYENAKCLLDSVIAYCQREGFLPSDSSLYEVLESVTDFSAEEVEYILN